MWCLKNIFGKKEKIISKEKTLPIEEVCNKIKENYKENKVIQNEDIENAKIKKFIYWLIVNTQNNKVEWTKDERLYNTYFETRISNINLQINIHKQEQKAKIMLKQQENYYYIHKDLSELELLILNIETQVSNNSSNLLDAIMEGTV